MFTAASQKAIWDRGTKIHILDIADACSEREIFNSMTCPRVEFELSLNLKGIPHTKSHWQPLLWIFHQKQIHNSKTCLQNQRQPSGSSHPHTARHLAEISSPGAHAVLTAATHCLLGTSSNARDQSLLEKYLLPEFFNFQSDFLDFYRPFFFASSFHDVSSCPCIAWNARMQIIPRWLKESESVWHKTCARSVDKQINSRVDKHVLVIQTLSAHLLPKPLNFFTHRFNLSANIISSGLRRAELH